MTEVDSNIIIGLVTILLPIIAGAFGLKTKQISGILDKTKGGFDIAKRYLFIANVVTNQVSLTIETISKSLDDDKITPEEAKIIGKQLATIVETLKSIGNNQELKDNNIVG
jgi:uncharacterized membrane protein